MSQPEIEAIPVVTVKMNPLEELISTVTANACPNEEASCVTNFEALSLGAIPLFLKEFNLDKNPNGNNILQGSIEACTPCILDRGNAKICEKKLEDLNNISCNNMIDKLFFKK